MQVEGEALAVGDASLLATVDHGRRLPDLQAAAADGERVVPSYRFDSLHLVVVFPGGVQSGPNAGFEATGTVTETVYRTGGALKTRLERPCCAGSATGAG